ncbi:MAG: hypothetical protein QOH30_4135, partial [Baekduia sp.]|nr:hypothetical protein [Baekduia sp.]
MEATASPAVNKAPGTDARGAVVAAPLDA